MQSEKVSFTSSLVISATRNQPHSSQFENFHSPSHDYGENQMSTDRMPAFSIRLLLLL